MSFGYLPPMSGIDANGIAQYGKGTVYPTFYAADKHMPYKSKEAGYPVYERAHYVKVIIPGEPAQVPVYEVNEEHKRRWPKEWEAYSKGEEQRKAGTPLSFLLPDSPDLVAQLGVRHIHTIQELATLTDTAVGQIPRGLHLVREAQEYMARTNNRANELDALRHQLEDAETAAQAAEMQRISDLQQAQAVQDRLMERLAALEAAAAKPEPKKKGWPAGKPRGPRKVETGHTSPPAGNDLSSPVTSGD